MNCFTMSHVNLEKESLSKLILREDVEDMDTSMSAEIRTVLNNKKWK